MAEAKQILQRFCFDVVRYGNAKSNVTETTYYYRQKFDENNEPIASRPKALDFLTKMIPGKESTDIPIEYIEEGYLQEADLIIEIGSDYTNSENYVDDPFYYLPAPKTSTVTTESNETDETE